jgi:hypothetical protein
MQDELANAIKSIETFDYKPAFQLELLEFKIKRVASVLGYQDNSDDINLYRKDLQSLVNLYCHIYKRRPLSTFNNIIILDDVD